MEQCSEAACRRSARAAPIPVTHGAPSVRSLVVSGFRVSSAQFPGSFRIDSHHHERACLSVIVDGFFEQRFRGRSVECPAGSVLVKPPEEWHRDWWGSAPTTHVIVEPERIDGALGPLRDVFETISHQVNPRAGFLARQLTRELNLEDDLAPLAIEALSLELVVAAGRRLRQIRADAPPPDWLRRCRDLLLDQYQNPPLMRELASEAGVHASTFSTSFRRAFGLSPGEYLREHRLTRARVDLEATQDDIAAVALRHGYADQSHFTRELKRHTGLTPAAYRMWANGGRGRDSGRS